MMRPQFLLVLFRTLLAAAGLLLVAASHAQNYPGQPIRMVVPYGAGTATDILARRLAAPLGTVLGQGVVIDNKAGASGNIALTYAARAPADGYTLLFGTTQTQSVNPHVLQNISYDPLKDFVSIGRVFNNGVMLVISSALPVTSVEELVAWLKANPSKANYGSTGVGTAAHLPAAYMAKLIGVNLTHVPYNNLGQLLSDVARGEVTMLFYTADGVKGFVDAGNLRPLAWTGPGRHPQFPAVPTMIERNYKDFLFGAWYGVFAPAGTPRPVVTKLADALRQVVNDPKFVSEIAATGATLYYAPALEMDAFIKTEYERFRQVISVIGMKKE